MDLPAQDNEMLNVYAVAVGDAFNGITLYGLFTDTEEAANWAMENIMIADWHVVNVNIVESKYTDVIVTEKMNARQGS